MVTASRPELQSESRSGPPAASPFGAFAQPFSGAQLFDIVSRKTACPDLPDNLLLHAGPPFRGAPPAPVFNAALQAILYEGLAEDMDGAAALLAGGAVVLAPAQDHGVVTPLAQVVSAGMPLLAVRMGGGASPAQPGQPAPLVRYAPAVEGPAPALRFGSADTGCQARLAALSSWLHAVVAPLLRAAPVDLHAVICAALADGDECHARTGVANEALVAAMTGLNDGDAARLRANPGFVLPVMMAAAAVVLAGGGNGTIPAAGGDGTIPAAGEKESIAAVGGNESIAAVGGNGFEFGLRLHGRPGWQTVAARAPAGTRFPGMENIVALGAIGDSAVLDICGLGAQALAAAPLLLEEWARILPADAADRRAAFIGPAGVVDVAMVRAGAIAPLVNLAILDAGGELGLIGRGFYTTEKHVFDSGSKPMEKSGS
jgi:hypothetical protein